MKNTQGGEATQTGLIRTKHEQDRSAIPEAVKYCLYARKSSESAERQVLSIDSQTKETLQITERDGLNVVEINYEVICEVIGGDLVEEMKLLDQFENEQKLGAGKISYTFRITYRGIERTLTNEEVNALHKKLEAETQSVYHAVIR